MNYLSSLRFEPLLAFLCQFVENGFFCNLLRRFKVSGLVKSFTIFTILMNNSPQNFKENANVQSLSKRGSIYTIFLDFKFNTRPPSSTRKLMNIQHVTSDGKIFCDIYCKRTNLILSFYFQINDLNIYQTYKRFK